jgi:L-alanine-DL-glutamate epimerase-like enolase superfamily enzyme
VSGLSDGMLVKLAACQTALACGCAGPAALNGSQFMDDAGVYPDKARFERDGAVVFGDEPGIGIEPDPEALRALAWEGC